MKLNGAYNNLIQGALKELSNNIEPEKKMTKRQSSMYQIT